MTAAKKITMTKFDPENMRIYEAAAYLGIALGTFYNMRSRGEGPRYRKAMGGIRYRKSDLDQWQKENTIEPGS